MTIAIEIEPELEQRVSSQAQARGVTLAEYVREALEEKARSGPRIVRREPTMTVEELVDALVYRGPIPEEMHTQKMDRAFIYGDHA